MRAGARVRVGVRVVDLLYAAAGHEEAGQRLARQVARHHAEAAHARAAAVEVGQHEGLVRVWVRVRVRGVGLGSGKAGTGWACGSGRALQQREGAVRG